MGFLDAEHTDFRRRSRNLCFRVIPRSSACSASKITKCIEQNVPLAKLSLKDFQDEYDGFDDTVFSILGAENAVSAMKSYGSTAPEQVRKQIDDWKIKLGEVCQG